jgi:tricorn protease
VALVAIGLAWGPADAQDISDTRMLEQPAMGGSSIAFLYAGDLWVANRDGTAPRRLTTHDGNESSPRFSPDGRLIAFSAQYDGNTDVFVVPVEGGVPTRLTWHPGSDRVQGFTPDGESVLFTSARAVHTTRYTQLFLVPVEGGHPQQLPIPNAAKATYSPDGRMIAYTPLGDRFNQWKNYRGGTATRIWLYNTRDHSVAQIPQPPGRCNDTDPMWFGDRVYFRSDRNGEFNIFSYDSASGDLQQLTSHADFPIVNCSAGSDGIIYEQAGYLHVYDASSARSTRLRVGVAADLIETRPRFASASRFLRSGSISPTGARAVVEFRGEIITIPPEKGDHRNLTNTTSVHEQYPAWSPDGKWIAYFSDASGEYELHIAPQDGRGDVRRFELGGAGFYDDLKWSPDGTKISFSDNSWALYWIDVESGRVQEVARESLYGPQKTLFHSWSPDSRWLAYTLNTMTYFQQVHIYSVEEDRSWALTDGLSDVHEPVFDAGGKYLYFYASTDAGPVNSWFAMSNADMEMRGTLYLAVLARGVESPLASESDEEAVEEEGAGSQEEESGEEEEVAIDFDGLSNRIVTMPVGQGYFYNLQAGQEGQLYYIKTDQVPGGAGEASLVMFDLSKREEETLLDAAQGFDLSFDKKKIMIINRSTWLIANAGGRINASEGRLSTGDLEVRIDPRAEWEQIFNEAWRINRDYFYDPNMHGANWPAMREKYSVFLPDIATRSDLNRVIMWMCSEVGVGHHRVGGGDFLYSTDSIPGGLLGADFDIDRGRYRFAKVYGGLNWTPNLRSPLTEPGVDVGAGEYLLAVNGRDLRPPENLYSRFENTSGKRVEITVASDTGGRDARTVTVVPIASESSLRNRDWVESNIQKVHEATDGRVAYVYVPNTSTAGHTYFKRYFFPQADKEAIIVDERFNGGGSVADYYIDLLRRPYISHWAMRYGDDLMTPLSSIHGPKVMLIDETAGSGGDLLPWMFNKLGLGKLIGRRTWGGLVGTLGFPALMDGGSVTAPNLAIWTEDGFVVENVGVPPDIEVEQWPADVIAGRDPQLERAIEEILLELEANPPKQYVRPPFPIRVKPPGR